MFANCSKLVNAPSLPETTLTTSCYSYMFYRAALLNNIQIGITTGDISNALNMFQLKSAAPIVTLNVDTDEDTFNLFNVNTVTGDYTILAIA
jgi:hypothetical protein